MHPRVKSIKMRKSQEAIFCTNINIFCVDKCHVKNIAWFCVWNMYHFALNICYILRQKLLHLRFMLHFAPNVVTFCGVMATKEDWTSRVKRTWPDFLIFFSSKHQFNTLLINLDWNMKEIPLLLFCGFLSLCFALGLKKGVCLLSPFFVLFSKSKLAKTLCRH